MAVLSLHPLLETTGKWFWSWRKVFEFIYFLCKVNQSKAAFHVQCSFSSSRSRGTRV